jgi:hypothetical protein
MNEHICECCGETFMRETAVNRLLAVASVVVILVSPWLTISDFVEGRQGSENGIYCLVWTAIGILWIVVRIKEKKDRTVQLGRSCPSCGSSTIRLFSPLGCRILEQWRTSGKIKDGEQVDESSEKNTSDGLDSGETMPTIDR